MFLVLCVFSRNLCRAMSPVQIKIFINKQSHLFLYTGQYQCFAENEWGTATSNSAFVRKAELNSFKDEVPQTLMADEGKPFKLTCQPPDGWPKPSVYWLIQVISLNQLTQELNKWLSVQYSGTSCLYIVKAALGGLTGQRVVAVWEAVTVNTSIACLFHEKDLVHFLKLFPNSPNFQSSQAFTTILCENQVSFNFILRGKVFNINQRYNFS